MLKLILVVGAVVSMVTPALANSIYSWRTPDGGVAFTDDPERIPPAYRDQAQVRKSTRLDDYGRYSTARESSGVEEYQGSLAGRVERLRVLNDEHEYATEVRGAQPQITVPTGGRDGSTVTLSPDGSDDPVVIEKIRMRPSGTNITRHNTIVRQGDRVLMVIKGNQGGSLDFPEEDSFDLD